MKTNYPIVTNAEELTAAIARVRNAQKRFASYSQSGRRE